MVLAYMFVAKTVLADGPNLDVMGILEGAASTVFPNELPLHEVFVRLDQSHEDAGHGCAVAVRVTDDAGQACSPTLSTTLEPLGIERGDYAARYVQFQLPAAHIAAPGHYWIELTADGALIHRLRFVVRQAR